MMSALEANFGQTPSQTVGPYFAYGLTATQYGYDFDQPFDAVLALDGANPQVAARMLSAFRSWRILEPNRRRLAEAELHRVAAQPKLARDVGDIAQRTLADA